MRWGQIGELTPGTHGASEGDQGPSTTGVRQDTLKVGAQGAWT